MLSVAHSIGESGVMFQDQEYVPVETTERTSRLELGGYVCANGYIPKYLEEDVETGVQGGITQTHPGANPSF